MIRPATFGDIPAMSRLLMNSHERSKYARRTGISTKAMEQMLLALVAAQKQCGPQAAYVQVATRGDEVVGFMAGVLNRVYNIGEKLVANDVFLVNESRSLKDTLALIDGYIDWARSNPKVIEVGLSWSDALPNARDIASIYRRKGAHSVGEQFEIRLDARERVAA